MNQPLPHNFPTIDYLAAPMGGMVRSTPVLTPSQFMDRFDSGVGGGGGVGRPNRPFSQVSAVFACVKVKAESLALMPLRVSDANDQILESGPLVDLVARPCPEMSGRMFWRASSACLDLFGRVHWRKTVDAAGLVIGLRVISPLLMSPVLDFAIGAVTAWDCRDAISGKTERLTIDQVHTVVDPDYEDPSRPYQGISARKAAGAAIAQYYKADLANEASLDNGVEPGGVLTMPGQPTEEQIRQTREQINLRQAGVRNRSRPLLLWGDMSWETIARAFSEMEFSELKKMGRTDICVAFNVPPAVVGYFEDSNYAHADSSEKSFWFRTILPRAAWLAEEFSEAVKSLGRDVSLSARQARTVKASIRQRTLPSWRQPRDAARRAGLSLYAWFDAADVPVVQKSRLDQAEAGKAWIDKGVPLNAVIDAFDLPFEEVPWGDTWYKPMGLVDVRSDALDGPGSPAANDPPGSPGSSGATSGGAAGDPAQAGEAPDETMPTDKALGSVEARATEAQLAAIWLSWRGSWSGLEKAAEGRIRRHFLELRAEVLRKLEASGLGRPEGTPAPTVYTPKALTIEQRASLFSVLFDLVESGQKLIARVSPLLREAINLGGAQAMQEAADATGATQPDPFIITDPQVQASVRQREIKLTNATATLRKQLAQALADGVAQQETTSQLAERVRQQFNFAGTRATTIARTEVGGAVEDARQIGRGQAGTPMKSWLWSRKETGRKNHQEEEAITADAPIANTAEFVLPETGARTLYPRGPGLGPDDAINCGCTTLARYPGDSLKSVIARYQARGFLTYEQLQRKANP